jgi:hypothetical protein
MTVVQGDDLTAERHLRAHDPGRLRASNRNDNYS